MSKKGTSSYIGKIFAHFQGAVDDILEFGFKKLKKAGKPKEENTETFKGKVFFGMKKVARFIGDVGESFYDEYEKIKAQNAEEQKKQKGPRK